MKSKTIVRLALALAMVCGLAVAARAADAKEVTLKGEIGCAHCTFHSEGVKECQDALQVKNAEGKTDTYFLAKNDALKKFGHTCQGTKSATVTGTVSEKGGQKWIEASKIEQG